MALTLDKTKVDDLLAQYAELRETTVPNALHMVARLLCVELARRTQPFGDNDDAKTNGENAIARDLLGKGSKRAGLFAPISPAIQAGLHIAKSSDLVRLFVTKKGDVYGTDRWHYREDAGQSDLREFHKGKFVNGKVSSAGGYTRDIGRWKFVDKMFAKPAAIKDYLKYVKAKVGRAKAGWADCAKELRQVVAGSMTRGIPGWVTRHLKGDLKFSGTITDKIADPINPTITLKNGCSYATDVLPPTEQTLACAIMAAKLRTQMAHILKKRDKILRENL